MTLAPQKHSKTMIAISTPHISTFDLSPPEWKLHTGVERSKVEVANPIVIILCKSRYLILRVARLSQVVSHTVVPLWILQSLF